MFDTTVTIIGNALTAPDLRQVNGTGTNVASFRVASTSRRYDRDNGRWVDGPSLRVRVTCWRRLAESVKRSVVTGDPLVVTGRMYTRDWVGEDGQNRVSYELEAVAVGHDLSRGYAEFTRHRPNSSTTVVEDAESEMRVRGELAHPVPPAGPVAADVPSGGGSGGFGGLDETDRDDISFDGDALDVLQAVGLAPGAPADQPAGDPTGEAPEGTTAEGAGESRPAVRRGRARVPQPA